MSAHDEVCIRKATSQDLPEILRIYNDAVLNTTATLDLFEKTLEERVGWLTSRSPHHPVVVIESTGSLKSTVLGWASLSPWAERLGYRITAEPSLYVDAPHRGKGFGKLLMSWIVEEADRQGFRSSISRVDAANSQSVELHLKFGFERIGTLHESGMKFGRLIDVALLQRMNSQFSADRWPATPPS